MGKNLKGMMKLHLILNSQTFSIKNILVIRNPSCVEFEMCVDLSFGRLWNNKQIWMLRRTSKISLSKCEVRDLKKLGEINLHRRSVCCQLVLNDYIPRKINILFCYSAVKIDYFKANYSVISYRNDLFIPDTTNRKIKNWMGFSVTK